MGTYAWCMPVGDLNRSQTHRLNASLVGNSEFDQIFRLDSALTSFHLNGSNFSNSAKDMQKDLCQYSGVNLAQQKLGKVDSSFDTLPGQVAWSMSPYEGVSRCIAVEFFGPFLPLPFRFWFSMFFCVKICFEGTKTEATLDLTRSWLKFYHVLS